MIQYLNASDEDEQVQVSQAEGPPAASSSDDDHELELQVSQRLAGPPTGRRRLAALAPCTSQPQEPTANPSSSDESDPIQEAAGPSHVVAADTYEDVVLDQGNVTGGDDCSYDSEEEIERIETDSGEEEPDLGEVEEARQRHFGEEDADDQERDLKSHMLALCKLLRQNTSTPQSGVKLAVQWHLQKYVKKRKLYLRFIMAISLLQCQGNCRNSG